MPAHDDGTTHSGAGVRKPPTEETAGGGRGGASQAMGISALAVCCRRSLNASLGSGRRGDELSRPIAIGRTSVAQRRLIDKVVSRAARRRAWSLLVESRRSRSAALECRRFDANEHALAADVTDLQRDHLGGAKPARVEHFRFRSAIGACRSQPTTESRVKLDPE